MEEAQVQMEVMLFYGVEEAEEVAPREAMTTVETARCTPRPPRATGDQEEVAVAVAAEVAGLQEPTGNSTRQDLLPQDREVQHQDHRAAAGEIVAASVAHSSLEQRTREQAELL